MATPAPQDAWEGILDPDERILWQGRPDGAWTVQPTSIFMAIFGAFFAGFAFFWMVMVASNGGFAWMFGLLHFSIGAGLFGFALFGNTVRRRYSWYTLTTRRAFIARALPFAKRALQSYPITQDTRLDFVDADPGTIWFAHEFRNTRNGSRKHNVGFERIPDARGVYALMRSVQRGEA